MTSVVGREEKGAPIERTYFMHTFFVLNQGQYVFLFSTVRNSSTWDRNYKITPHAPSIETKVISYQLEFGK